MKPSIELLKLIAILCFTGFLVRIIDHVHSEKMEAYHAMENCQTLRGTWDSTWRICYITRVEASK